VLVSSAWKGRTNIMTMGWHMVMGEEPSPVGCFIWDQNHSFETIRRSRECMIAGPTVRRYRKGVRPEMLFRTVGGRLRSPVSSLPPADGRALPLGAFYLLEDGDQTRAEEWSDGTLALAPDDMSALINGACLRARPGQKKRALGLPAQVTARGWGKRDWIDHDPDYDSLRDEPRFQAVLARLK
jgi:hypothetical protein